MSLELQVTSSTIPADLECVITNARWQQLVELLLVTMPAGTKINYGNSEPAPADRIWPWFRSNTDGTPDRLYYYALGKWLSKHSQPPDHGMIYFGSEASIDTFDGGEAGAVTPTSGPFWQKVTEMNAKMPIGAGAGVQLESGTNVPVAGSGGAERVTLEPGDLPTNPFNPNATGLFAAVSSGGTFSVDTTGSGTTHRVVDWEGAGESHSNMPPWFGVLFLKRTQRLYYRVP